MLGLDAVASKKNKNEGKTNRLPFIYLNLFTTGIRHRLHHRRHYHYQSVC